MVKKYLFGSIINNTALQPPKLTFNELFLKPLNVVPDTFIKQPLLNFQIPKLTLPKLVEIPKATGKTPALKNFANNAIQSFKENPNFYGTVASLGSAVLGNRPEYNGDKGYITQTGDVVYDALGNAVSTIPGWGQAAWAGMQGVKLLGKVAGKLGASTDGNTTGDAVMGIPGINITPLAIINGITGSRADRLAFENYYDAAQLNKTADAYNQDEKERAKAKELSGTKFGGIFGRKGLRDANALINEENQDALTRLAIAKDMNLQKIRSQYMTSINNLNYLNLINGILNPIAFGLKGMKMNKRRLKKISKMAKSYKAKQDEPVEHWKKPDNWNDEKIPYEEWVKDVNPNYLDENYDLKMAYESEMPKEDLERWKWAVNSNNPKYYMDYKDSNGKYIYHLGSIAPLTNGDFIFLKKGNEKNNPELHFETDSYWNGNNGLINTHNLSYEGDRYYYRKKDTQAFKLGGQLNLIPEGALHARKNNMEGAGKDFTAKGIPVVDNLGNQLAEIEREELILNKDNTNYIEERYKKFYSDDTSEEDKNKLAIEVGKKFVKELFTNTDDRTGLIEKVENKI